ncbi:MAG: S-methyl-5-thioribose-1-phosphate isomerase [Bacteroidota bacterium]
MKEHKTGAIGWKEGKVWFLDQTRIPAEQRVVETNDPSVLAGAIRTLSIRGAPLIGIAAAYGVALDFISSPMSRREDLPSRLARVQALFASTRPTAVNLFWALERMRETAESFSGNIGNLGEVLLNEAVRIHEEDRLTCEQIGIHGAALISPGMSVLTHCNTGALATGGIGTAFGIIRTAWEKKVLRHVYVDETRPLLQGARLTAWELTQLGIPSTLITDSTAAFLMLQGRIQAVLVGADRIAANGDVANKVGTYGLAVTARYHAIPFYVAAPTSTIDSTMKSGKDIPIEVRDSAELLRQGERAIAPIGMEVYAPAFDVTPNELITAIITEYGVVSPPFGSHLPTRQSSLENFKK